MKSQEKIRKIVVVVLYRFVHGFNPKHMLYRFDVEAFVIQKYTNIICGVLCDIK
jgi:hypothetical protein